MNLQHLLNRLDKNQRQLAKWVKSEDIQAYRLYDRDMPEFPFAIDRYGEALHVQVFERKRPLEEEQLSALCEALLQHYGLQPEQLGLKTRRRQRGVAQYEKLALNAPSFQITEQGLNFEINLHRYLDTGLFLDHRETRRRVGAQAEGKSLLNLFAYTGSFSVYAAAGGALRTLSVDLSKTYQAWTERNLRHNGLHDEQRHKLLQGDVLSLLQRLREAGSRFDLIVLDPPSFSNSKRMQNTFDVQRDQVSLLRDTLALLTPGGTLYFSNNRQGFSLDPAIEQEAEVHEITAQTIPRDFARYRPHSCWTLQR